MARRGKIRADRITGFELMFCPVFFSITDEVVFMNAAEEAGALVIFEQFDPRGMEK